MNNRKKRIGFVTNAAMSIKTGFARNCSALLSFLYKTDKYEIFHLVQAFHEKDPRLKMQPWHSQGVFNDQIVNTEQFQKDGNFQRIVSYGNLAVKDWVIKNELDCVVHVEDIWSSNIDAYLKQDWFSFLKNNFVQHTTLDSLPILPDAFTWAEKCDNFWCWSDFAERAMKKADPEKYSKVETVYGTLNCDHFKPISKEEKKELRKRFNIAEDDVLICFLSRNQLRKLFHSNMEGLAKYKKQFPEGKKIKLLFHTCWTEGAGWPLERIRNELGLEKEDVLATYFCPKCKNWAILPFLGEPLKCPYCNDEKSFVTAGITSTITEQELSKIYGICDAMCHLMTSGGLEYAMVEGLLCGLPLATVNYSCGETFAEQPFVESIDYSLTREVGTAFLKAVPNPNSVAKYFKKISDSVNTDKYRDVSRAGRNWALNNFHVDVIGKKFEKFFDNAEFLDWSNYHEFKKDYDVKNPQAEIPQTDSDLEFVKLLYKNILKMDVEDNDEGLLSWYNNFKSLPQNAPDAERNKIRNQIEQSFRKIALEHNNQNNQVDFKTFVDLERPNKRLLFVMAESGGDIFLSTSLLKDLKNKYGQDTDVYFMTQIEKFGDILSGNPYIHKVIPWFEPMANEMVAIGAGQEKKDALFNYCICPAGPTQKYLNYLSHEKAGEII